MNPLHRFLLEREDWDYERILADKGKQILRSDRGKSTRGMERRDMVIDEGEGIFIHIDSGRHSSYAPDPQIAEVSASHRHLSTRYPSKCALV